MSLHREIRGGTPVGTLDGLPPDEARLIRLLRGWCDGADGQKSIWNDLALAIGPGAARSALSALEHLLHLFAEGGRRPLTRHHGACRCVGSDEAVFARLVVLAASGEREEAMLLASHLLRADLLAVAVDLAQTLGLHLMRLELRRAPQRPRRAGQVLH